MTINRHILKFLGFPTLLICSIFFLTGSRSFKLPPTSGYTEVGVSVGENGESHVNIPIALPKGTVLTPELSIGYNSQAGNGLLGQGFQLEGLYTITRQAANKAQDGVIDGVDFDALDRFALNGERLVKTKGTTYGGNNTEYRTEQNNFSRVRSYGTAGAGPAWFKVWTKSGLIMEFGNTTDSRIEVQGGTDAMLWLVNRISDTKGNYATFSYIEENAKGEFRIDKIQYTGNTNTGLLPYNLVQFTYENRPDSTVSYFLGKKIGASKRLAELTTFDNGVQYRRYQLEYMPSTDLGLGNKSFLKSIKEYGVGNTAFEPTTFKWTNRNIFPTVENTFATGAYAAFNTQPDRIRVGDVTGDGKMDMVLGPDQTTGNWYVLRSTGSSFVQETWALGTNTPSGWKTMLPQLTRLMDVNSDGLLDVCVGPDASGNWYVMKSNGNGFGSVETWLLSGFSPNIVDRVWITDVNGDERQDIVVGPIAGGWEILLNTGNGFQQQLISAASTWNGTPEKIHLMDANGDGQTDFVFGPNTDGKWHTFLNMPSFKTYTDNPSNGAGEWINNAYASWVGKQDRIWNFDFNGDDLNDFILGPEETTGKWYLLLNRGNSFEDKGAIATGMFAAWFDKTNKIKPQDLNGDGLMDFLFQPINSGDEWKCMFNTGKGFELGYDNGFWLYDAYDAWANSANLIRQMDMNGDGKLDICFGPDATGKWEMMSNRVSQNHPYLLEAVVNGHGGTTEIVYEELTRSDVYQKGTGAVFPKVDFIAPLYVVSQIKSNDGLGGKNAIHYKYYDAKLDVSGRGFRGFGKTEQIDSLRGTKNVTIFERQHQYLSTKVSATEQWLLNYNGAAKLLYSSETALDTFEYFNETVHFSFINNSTEKWYDLNSTLPYKTKTAAMVYDRDWGNVTQMTEEYKEGTTTKYTIVTTNTYAGPDTVGNNWILGRLTQASVSKTFVGKPTIIKQSTFAYQAGSGLLTQEILNSSSSSLKLQKDYTLDSYGNRLTEAISGPNITSRTSTMTYDTQGRLVTSTKNPLNQIATYTYLNGLPQSTTDPNGLSETVTRDAFGRPTSVMHVDGTQTNTFYYKCDGSQVDAPYRAIYYVETEKAGAGKNRVFYDILDRELRKVEYGLDNQIFYTDTEYDKKGLVTRKSDPYRDSPTWHTYEYDATYRMVKETAPGNLTNTMSYAGLTTIATNAEGQTATRISNVMGWLLQSKDHQNNIVNYDYDSDGNMTQVTDPVGNITKMFYDSRGNKTSMEDPDLGILSYEYNTLGLMTKQTYGGGQSISITYDILDRKIRQVERKNAAVVERTLGWKYDIGNKGIGRVAADSINGVLSKQFLYDNSGRLMEEKEKIEGADYSTVYEYDTYGRLRVLNYPGVSDFKLRYNYDNYGHLKSICQPNTTNGNCATTFWQVDSLNNRGQVTKFTLGNGLVTRKNYDVNTGYLLGIKTGNTTNQSIVQNLSYQFSALGNLTQRKDIGLNLTENFQFDNLNRLTSAQVVGQTAVTVQYNSIGNITYKSNVGTYIYGGMGAGPHMVTDINHAGIPNCFYEFNGTLENTVYNYPKKVKDGQDSINFTYDAARAKQTQYYYKGGALKWKKHYVNNLTERIVEGSVIKTILHIKAGGETVAILKKQNNVSTDTLRYMHHDHLGSLNVITREDGMVDSRHNYDAWGKNRQAYTWAPILTASAPPPFQRGFTWHEMMGIDDLVHMNARLYDPTIGRFLSADPTVQFPDNLQSLNRASYVLNNPLSFTDPTGFGIFKRLRNIVRENIGTIVTIAIAVALAPATGGVSLGYAIASGAAAGFGGAFVGTLANGGDIGDAIKNGLKGGAIGAVSAGLSYGVGSVFGDVATGSSFSSVANEVGRAAAHGVVQGAIAEGTGGSFANGFITGLGSSLAGSYLYGNLSTLEARVAAGAAVGGTLSKLTGGSFANGAITGAFVQLYNKETQREKAYENTKASLDIANAKNKFLAEKFGANAGFFKSFSKISGVIDYGTSFYGALHGDPGSAAITALTLGGGLLCAGSGICALGVAAAGALATFSGGGDYLNNNVFIYSNNSAPTNNSFNQYYQNQYQSNMSSLPNYQGFFAP